jgi:flavorubredoxin
MTTQRHGPTGHLPRQLYDNMLWTGRSTQFNYNGKIVYTHLSVYLLIGKDATMLVDSGHPIHWKEVRKDVEEFLDGRPLDYLFLTHPEFPHAGLIENWLRLYPNAVACGPLADLRFYYPNLAHRIRPMEAGDVIDLGDMTFRAVPAIWRDLKASLWGFEETTRTLFVSDAFAYMHYHDIAEEDFMTSERPTPDLHMMQFINERALYWTKYADAQSTFGDIDKLLGILKPKLIAPAHGSVVDTIDATVPVVKNGMRVMYTS